MTTYEDVIARKSSMSATAGIEQSDIPPWMFPHQAALTRWALRKGRAAVFAQTGLGKTAIELVWAQHVVRHTGGRVLVLAPLAVAQQIVAEGATRGIECSYLRADDGVTSIVVANYEMLHAFDAGAFAGVALDESSILKALDGKTRSLLIEKFAATPFRLCASATPAPNDFTELGNHSQFLGVKSHSEMLAEYFVHDGGSTQDWRLKGHAQRPFWRWVASWGAVIKSPEDLGFDGSAYQLPPLNQHSHVVHEELEDAQSSGLLFPQDARTLQEQRRVRRATVQKRVEVAARIASEPGPCVVWCELNQEADACERAIDGAVQVSGSDDLETKVERLTAFARGDVRVLISKTGICGHGLNWQHCSRTVFVGASNSYEQTYQAIRRFWRFGQRNPVDVHTVYADTERFVVENYRRKEADADRMAAELREHVGEFVLSEVVGRSVREWNDYKKPSIVFPEWL